MTDKYIPHFARTRPGFASVIHDLIVFGLIFTALLIPYALVNHWRWLIAVPVIFSAGFVAGAVWLWA